jgi:hypothetical protein
MGVCIFLFGFFQVSAVKREMTLMHPGGTMLIRKPSRFLFLLLLFCAPVSHSAWALGPMYGLEDLVAGESSEGYRDGQFYSALFHSPTGLALDPGHNRLYVSDSGNHCIRWIDLARSNEVSTLTGTGKADFKDGPLNRAAFNKPTAMVFLPGERLLVFDSGNFRLRLVDAKAGSVTTLAGSGQAGMKDGDGPLAQVGNVWNMATLPGEDAVYFSEPESGALRKVELKSGKVTTLFKNNPEIPHPAALCAGDNRFYIADRDKDQVFQLVPRKPKEGETAPGYELKPSCPGSKILGLAWSDEALYALEADGNTPVARLLPSVRRVGFLSAWGREEAKPGKWGFWSDLSHPSPMGFIPDRLSDRKFYIAHPFSRIVTSLRDLQQTDRPSEEYRNSKGLPDFEYPTAKPPRVFRIMTVGDSRAFHISSPTQSPADHNLMFTLSKKMEWNLNTIAALADSPTRYEVITYGKLSRDPLFLWPTYEVPGAVKKFDIDLVLFLLSPNDYTKAYFERPIGAEGIPAWEADPELLAKNIEERVPSGVAKRYYDLCREKKLFDAEFSERLKDPEIRKCMVEMTGRPIKMLAAKLAGMKTAQGAPVALEMCLVPEAHLRAFDDWKSFFVDVIKMTGAPYMDFTNTLTAFRISYYPFSEMKDSDHLFTDGHNLMGFLLTEELINQKLVPLKRK